MKLNCSWLQLEFCTVERWRRRKRGFIQNLSRMAVGSQLSDAKPVQLVAFNSQPYVRKVIMKSSSVHLYHSYYG